MDGEEGTGEGTQVFFSVGPFLVDTQKVNCHTDMCIYYPKYNNKFIYCYYIIMNIFI